MNNLTSAVDSLEWRRSKVLEYLSKGYSQSEIADVLMVSQPTIVRDQRYIRDHARENLKSFVEKRLPEEVAKAFTSYDYIVKTASHIADNTHDQRLKMQALNLVKETRAAIIDLASNTNAIDYHVNLARDNNNNNNNKKEKEEPQDSDTSRGVASEEYEDLEQNEE